jgi:hypothetical protein
MVYFVLCCRYIFPLLVFLAAIGWLLFPLLCALTLFLVRCVSAACFSYRLFLFF